MTCTLSYRVKKKYILKNLLKKCINYNKYRIKDEVEPKNY